jgi:hypothetical protein
MTIIGPTFDELLQLLPSGITVSRSPTSKRAGVIDQWYYELHGRQIGQNDSWPPLITLWRYREFHNDERAECWFLLARARDAAYGYYLRLANLRDAPPKTIQTLANLHNRLDTPEPDYWVKHLADYNTLLGTIRDLAAEHQDTEKVYSLLDNISRDLCSPQTLKKKIRYAVARAKGICPHCGQPWEQPHRPPAPLPPTEPQYLEVHPSIVALQLAALPHRLQLRTRGRNILKNMIAAGELTDITRLTWVQLLRWPECGLVTMREIIACLRAGLPTEAAAESEHPRTESGNR